MVTPTAARTGTSRRLHTSSRAQRKNGIGKRWAKRAVPPAAGMSAVSSAVRSTAGARPYSHPKNVPIGASTCGASASSKVRRSQSPESICGENVSSKSESAPTVSAPSCCQTTALPPGGSVRGVSAAGSAGGVSVMAATAAAAAEMSAAGSNVSMPSAVS